jgi:hypothetical protein
MADHSLEGRERYFSSYTTIVSVPAGSESGKPVNRCDSSGFLVRRGISRQ